MTKEKPQLKEITENEFNKLIFQSIDFCNDEIAKNEGYKQTFMRLYRDYQLDKESYHMNFFLEENGYVSYKINEKTIGFHK